MPVWVMTGIEVMMSFWNSKHVKKTRKDHFCLYCESTIKAGASCWNEAGTFEGDFNNYYLCERCRKLISSGEPWYENGDELGTLFDNLVCSNISVCPNCKSYRNSFLRHDEKKDAYVFECDDCGLEFDIDLSAENLLANYSK